MGIEHFLFAFVLFGFAGALLWLLGAATLSAEIRTESFFRAPWLGCGIIVGVLQIVHIFLPITSRTSLILLAAFFALAIFRLVPQVKGMRRGREDLRPILRFVSNSGGCRLT